MQINQLNEMPVLNMDGNEQDIKQKHLPKSRKLQELAIKLIRPKIGEEKVV